MKIINERKMYTCQIKNILLVNNSKKTLIKIGIYFIFFSIAILIALIPNIMNRVNSIEQKPVRFATDLKYILIWKQFKKSKKNFYNRNVDYLPGQAQFIKQNCPNINCYFTYNKSLLISEDNFDAIVFDIHDMKKLKVNNINLGRNQDQIYIFKSQEPAEYHTICNPLYDDVFNWTWTYKLNSDIPHPFINIHDANDNLIGPSTKIDWVKEMRHTVQYKSKINEKSKAVAWLVSNCKLKHKHLDFVRDLRVELKSYNLTLDTFGPCSEKKCPKGGLAKCLKIIDKEYYFNLVLEDSSIEDYITEKMVKGMTSLSVPILNGFTNYTNFLPPGSYINARELDIKKLGSIIDFLIKYPQNYSYLFDWKTYYHYTTRPRTYVCDLCTKLNEGDQLKKSYKEFRRWWNPEYEDNCQRVQLYSLFTDTT